MYPTEKERLTVFLELPIWLFHLEELFLTEQPRRVLAAILISYLRIWRIEYHDYTKLFRYDLIEIQYTYKLVRHAHFLVRWSIVSLASRCATSDCRVISERIAISRASLET